MLLCSLSKNIYIKKKVPIFVFQASMYIECNRFHNVFNPTVTYHHLLTAINNSSVFSVK